MAGDRGIRVLLKLSGEALCAPGGRGLDIEAAGALAREIARTAVAGVEIAVVIGGGNFFRGAELAGTSVRRDDADRMGMLATLMNGLALRDIIRDVGAKATLHSGLVAPEVADTFDRAHVEDALAEGAVAILAGGTGRPFFTTDTAAALRALELGCDRLLKATKVDGIYSADPEIHPDATRYDTVTFAACLENELKVMDSTAFALCRDNRLEIVVFDMKTPGAILAAARGEDIGTRVVSG